MIVRVDRYLRDRMMLTRLVVPVTPKLPDQRSAPRVHRDPRLPTSGITQNRPQPLDLVLQQHPVRAQPQLRHRRPHLDLAGHRVVLPPRDLDYPDATTQSAKLIPSARRLQCSRRPTPGLPPPSSFASARWPRSTALPAASPPRPHPAPPATDHLSPGRCERTLFV